MSILPAELVQAAPDVPWWGELLMALVATALAFFSGRRAERKRNGNGSNGRGR